jgi:hypothetical protein
MNWDNSALEQMSAFFRMGVSSGTGNVPQQMP